MTESPPKGAITTNQEYADLVPPLSTEEYESLKESIKQNGLWVPIVVNNQGVVLDGHHRFKACQELGIEEPKTTTMELSMDRAGAKIKVDIRAGCKTK
jgi:ParB-like chromosome segregation protein Spo0J